MFVDDENGATVTWDGWLPLSETAPLKWLNSILQFTPTDLSPSCPVKCFAFPPDQPWALSTAQATECQHILRVCQLPYLIVVIREEPKGQAPLRLLCVRQTEVETKEES